MLRGAGLTAVGLSGAALLGCGGDDDDDDAPSGGTTAPGSTTAPGETPQASNFPVVEGSPKPGGAYTIAATTTYLQHDAHTALGPNVWHLIGEKAFKLNSATGELEPNLIAEYEVPDDGTSIVLKVKPGLAMHDNGPWGAREFNAEDLAWNMMRIIGSTADAEGIPLTSFQRRSLLEGMDKAEAVDDLTVRVTMSKPNSSFLNALAENRMVLMPKEIVDVGFDDPMKMGGVGAFKMSAFEQGVKMTFDRADNYFVKDTPYFDRYEQLVIPDRAAQIAAFISGEISALGALQNHELTALKASKPDANLYEWVDTNWMHFRPNMTYGPFKDFRVRKALQLATDHGAMADGFWGTGWGYQAALHPAYPEAWKSDKVAQLPGYNKDTKDQDRKDALAMLEAAGFPNGDGIAFEILYVEQIPDTEENAIRFIEQMKEVVPGMAITAKGFPDLASYSKPQSEGDFQAVSYIITAVPDSVLEAITQFHSTGSRNYGKFNEPELDAILNKAQTELDNTARAVLMEDFQTRFMEEWQPLIVFYARPARTMLQGNIGGFDKTAGSWFGYGGLTEAHRWYQV